MKGYNTQIPFVIYSVTGDAIDAELEYLTNEGIKHSRVQGKYKGVEGHSILVHIYDSQYAYAAAHANNQDTVLEVDGFKTARLLSVPEGDVLKIGVWREARPAEENMVDSWTKDITTGKYYVVDWNWREKD